MVKNVSILGSTGSIGRQTLDVISNLQEVRVVALTAGTNWQLMAEQIRQFHPKLAVMADADSMQTMSTLFEGASGRVCT